MKSSFKLMQPRANAPSSLFESLLETFETRLSVVRCTVNTLVHLSHTLQDLALTRGLPALAFVGFQEAGDWQKETERCRLLSDAMGQVYFCAGMPLEKDGASVACIPLADDDPLRYEWFLVIVSDALSAVLCGVETRLPTTDKDLREFDAVWSFDPEIVGYALDFGEAVVDQYRPELLPGLRERRVMYRPSPPDVAIITRFTIEMVRFGETLQRVLLDTQRQQAQAYRELEQEKKAVQERETRYHILTELTSERKLAEQALQESAERFRLLAENSPDVIIIFDVPSNRSVYFNRAELLGYTSEELVQPGSILFAVHPDDQEKAIEFWQQLTSGSFAPLPALEYRVRSKFGSWEWLNHRATILKRDPGGTVTQFLSTITVITRRKQAEEALRYQASLLESISDAVISLDLNYRILSWNKAAEAMYGWSMDEVIGQPIGILQPEYPDDNADHVTAEFYAKGWWRGEMIHYRKDGTPIAVLTSSALLKDSHGVPVGLLAVHHDITERKQIEAERLEREMLRVALEKERELATMKNNFMTTVSHEFRTPLATILTASQLLYRHGHRFSPEERERRFHTIEEQVRHLSGMLDDISVILHEVNALDFMPLPLDLEPVCRDIVEAVQLSAQSKNPIRFTVSGDVNHVPIDERLFRRILNNLLSNAVKYSPNGSEVHFELSRQHEQLMLRIRDQGIGILPEDRPHLFEPFYRGSNVGAIGGTGLGLKIVKDGVELHRGTVTYESEVGVGTTFTVTLPAAYEQ